MITTLLAASLIAPQRSVWREIPSGPVPVTNPLKGYAPYDSPDSAHYEPSTLVYKSATWRELEPSEGVYKFDEWVNRDWMTPFAKDRHVVMRVMLDYPSRPPMIPQWLIDQGVAMKPYTDHGGGLCPDYHDPKLQEALLKLIDQLGKRFNGEKRLAYLQLGFLGHWGEWHTWPRDDLFASFDFQRKVVDRTRSAFPDKIMMMRTATNYAATLPYVGYFDDLIPDDTDDGQEWHFLPQIRAAKRDQNWKVAAIGGEMYPGQAKRFLGPDWGTTVAAIRNGHFSWMGPYCPDHEDGDEQFRQRRRELSQMMGYTFRLDSVKVPIRANPGDTVEFALKGTNIGNAPFYYPWPVRVGFVDSKGVVSGIQDIRFDLRSWLPGSATMETKVKLPTTPGNYGVAIGIFDPWKNRATVRFANEVPSQDGMAVVAKLQVASK